MTQSEIKNKTRLSIRSVKGSLNLLKDRGFVKEHAVLRDMRRKKYSLDESIIPSLLPNPIGDV